MFKSLWSSQDLISTEGVGFEPTVPFGTLVFKTRAINHSTTPPGGWVCEDPRKLSHKNVQLAWDAGLGGFDIGAGGAIELGGDPLAALAIDGFDLVGIARGLGLTHF